ncbi:YitT family protein [Pontiellaceae bacterium B1224]|nr:YitT family protein [Pontiellaceae bacterium B1224]
MHQKMKDYTAVFAGGLIYAFALKYFVLPAKVVLTGTEGIAVALSYYFSNYGLFIWLYAFFQFILLVFAFFKVSKRFAIRSMFTVCTVIILLALLPEFHFAQPEPQNERIILVLFGGLLAGVAKALAFKGQGSTADEDILGAYFAMKYLKPVGAIAVFAAVVSTGFGLIMDYLKNQNFESVINTLMYTCIYIFASTETLNNLYRKFQITMFSIITHNDNTVGKAITNAFSHRTFTVQSGVGGRSEATLSMVRTIITKEELPRLINVVEKADPTCFYYHHDIDGVSKRYYITPIG